MSKSSQRRGGPRQTRDPRRDAADFEARRKAAEAQQVNAFIQQLFAREETLEQIVTRCNALTEHVDAPMADELRELAEDATAAKHETSAGIIEALSHITGIRQPSPIETPTDEEVAASNATRADG